MSNHFLERKKLIENKNNQKWIPVISKTGAPLMPCHPARANQLLRKGRAKKQWRGGIFYIKLIELEDGETQLVACGIDPGSKKEAITVRDEKKTFLNIQLDAVTHVKDRVETRKYMRRSRRVRNCPYRKCHSNRSRKNNFIAPSTKARYDWKLKILHILNKLFPIKVFVYEDIKAQTLKGRRKWNVSFSPLQTGKKYFIRKLKELGEVLIKQGYETAEKRKELGLTKDRNKLSNSFFAHCIDSWTLAGFGILNPINITDNKNIMFIKKILFWKRHLHHLQFNKFGKRPRYGGTVSFGRSRGSIVKHLDFGLGRIGGFLTDSKLVGFHRLNDYKRDRNIQVSPKQLINLADCNLTWSYSSLK